MKRSYFPTTAVLFFALLVFTQCRKEDIAGSYQAINDITFNKIKDTLQVNQFEQLRITPEIKQRTADEAALLYEWKIQGDKMDSALVLSDTRNLDVVVTVPASSVPYTLILKVTDTRTGVAYFNEYKTSVSSSLGEGWVIMEEKTGGTELHLISPKGILYRNIYSGVNSGKLLPANTMGIASLPGLMEYRLYVFTADDLIMLTKDDFRHVANADKVFLFEKPDVVKPQDCFLDAMNNINMLINNGGLHNINFINQGPKLFSGRFSGDYRLAPFIANGWAYDGVAYDEKNGRFIFTPPFSTSLAPFPPRSAADAFDMSAVGMTLRFMDVGVNQYYHALFKDQQSSKYFLHTINPNAFDPQPVAVAKKEVKNNPEMDNAIAFATSGRTQQIYYAAGNSIYLYDIENDQLSRRIFTFPGSTTITAMKMLRTTTWMFFPGPVDDSRLVVATSEGDGGHVYYLDLSSTGEISNGNYSKKFDGFGNIKSITYKRPSF